MNFNARSDNEVFINMCRIEKKNLIIYQKIVKYFVSILNAYPPFSYELWVPL